MHAHQATSGDSNVTHAGRPPFTPGFASAFDLFRTENVSRIQALAEEVGEISDRAHWELVDEMKSALGSVSANDCAQDEDSQEKCIDAAEAWVAKHLGDGDTTQDVAMALWMKGDDAGADFLKRNQHADLRAVEGQRG